MKLLTSKLFRLNIESLKLVACLILAATGVNPAFGIEIKIGAQTYLYEGKIVDESGRWRDQSVSETKRIQDILSEMQSNHPLFRATTPEDLPADIHRLLHLADSPVRRDEPNFPEHNHHPDFDSLPIPDRSRFPIKSVVHTDIKYDGFEERAKGTFYIGLDHRKQFPLPSDYFDSLRMSRSVCHCFDQSREVTCGGVSRETVGPFLSEIMRVIDKSSPKASALFTASANAAVLHDFTPNEGIWEVPLLELRENFPDFDFEMIYTISPKFYEELVKVRGARGSHLARLQSLSDQLIESIRTDQSLPEEERKSKSLSAKINEIINGPLRLWLTRPDLQKFQAIRIKRKTK